MSDPTARALALLSLLQTHRHWKGAELADRLGVTERTVRRDVDRLRELGYPVDAAAGVEGGYRLAVGAHIPPLLLDDDEAIALVVGLQRAALSSVEGIEETTVQLMAKLDQVLPDRLRRRVDALRSSVEMMQWAPTTETVPAATLTVLSQGCRNNEEVRFEYRRRDGEESRRLVQPHQLVSAGRRWYLVAWDVRREDWRSFRLDRMVAPSLAGARFEPRVLPAEDAATFVTEGMRAMSTEYRATVVVGASPDELQRLSRWFGAELAAVDPPSNDTASRDTASRDTVRTQMELRAESIEWLASMVVIVATSHELDVTNAPDELHGRLAVTAERIGSPSATSGDGRPEI